MMLETSDSLDGRHIPNSDHTPDAAIAARSLRRTFKGGIEAVRDIDLTVSAGEVFGFLGPNGAGKTTTVRMLCTLLPPTAGSATVAGLDVVEDAAEIRRRIGVALQEIGLDPVQTGRELLELQCGLYGITGQRARAEANELLELVGLTEAADRRTKTYSGGMKRRLDLASALVHAPEVLFLDEPTTGLDPGLAADDLGRGAADQRRRRHRVPHHAVPRGGRQAVRSAGDHRQRPDRRRGHARAAQGRDGARRRVGLGRGRRRGRNRGRADRAAPDSSGWWSEPDGLALYVEDGPGSIAEIVRRLEREQIRAGAISVARPVPRRRVPEGHRPPARGRGQQTQPPRR